MPKQGEDVSNGGAIPSVAAGRRTLFRILANLPAFKAMFAKKRRGSVHEEVIVDGRAKCPVCGWLDEADPAQPEIRRWHVDTATGGRS